jgi:serine/threonine protein phosphatase PrpC
MEEIFRGVGRACRATRGVVMALARFDWGEQRLRLATLGNIEVRAWSAAGPLHFPIRRGIIGLSVPKPMLSEQRWLSENRMVLHSDGLSTRWSWDQFPKLVDQPARTIAQRLLRALAKEEDDATVLVVRNALV